jgi:predicted metalloprotease
VTQPPYQYGPPSVAPQQGPSLGWGPQFGSGQPGFQQDWRPQLPPKKPSKAPLFAILAFCLLGVIGLFVFGMIQKNADDNYTAPRTTEPSWRATSPMPTATEPTATEPTATEPTETETQQPTPTPTTDKPDDLAVVAKNKLYATGRLATSNCKESPARATTNANAAKYWAQIKPCLDSAWSRQVTLGGSRYRQPGMTYWSGTTVSTPCSGGTRSVPFYCSANHMMYMKTDAFVKVYNQYPDAESKAYARMWYTRSIAHEYGHAVQSMTGILQSAHQLRYEAATYQDRLLMSRRIELQANCFAGVFLAVNKRSYPIDGLLLRTWNKWVVTAGDPPNKGDHGSAASNVRFMGQAFNTGTPATCNTFAASPANVS